MKHITKGAGAPAFEAWKISFGPEQLPGYSDLQNPEKQALHAALLAEQGGVCCYCGRGITPQDSHIEHFRPQGRYLNLALDHGNLLASCIRETKYGAPLHCGHVKDDGFDEALHISPLDALCEARFLYDWAGRISPSVEADAQAGYMVELLKLDIAFLCNRRKEVLNSVFDPGFFDTMTTAELCKVRDAYAARDAQGQSPPFGHVVARYAEQRLLDATP